MGEYSSPFKLRLWIPPPTISHADVRQLLIFFLKCSSEVQLIIINNIIIPSLAYSTHHWLQVHEETKTVDAGGSHVVTWINPEWMAQNNGVSQVYIKSRDLPTKSLTFNTQGDSGHDVIFKLLHSVTQHAVPINFEWTFSPPYLVILFKNPMGSFPKPRWAQLIAREQQDTSNDHDELHNPWNFEGAKLFFSAKKTSH